MAGEFQFYGGEPSEVQVSIQPRFKAATSTQPETSFPFNDYDKAALAEYTAQKLACLAPDTTTAEGSTIALYAPLSTGQIRILELHPSPNFTSPLSGSLHTVNVDFSYPSRPMDPISSRTFTRNTDHAVLLPTGKPFWYTALSYVWGAPIFDDSVSIGDTALSISKSLGIALRHLRSEESESVFLWVDQICINQRDLRDKEQQIPLMGLIYSHATNTLIWLGVSESIEDGDEKLACETLQSVWAGTQYMDETITPADFARFVLPPVGDRAWWAVKKLLARPWFTRLWTIQEAILSQRLFIKYGSATENWDEFAIWCAAFLSSGLQEWLQSCTDLDERFGDVEEGGLIGASTVNTLSEERIFAMTHEHRPELLGVLVSVRYAKATEPKDKIYGILALADADIKLNYAANVSAKEVYHAACLTLPLYRIYRQMCCVDHENPPSELSWVPDWSTPRITESLGFSTKSMAVYKAAGSILTGDGASGLSVRVQLSDDQKRIALHGWLFDSISVVGDVATDALIDIDTPTQGNAQWATYINIAKESPTYPTEIPVFEAFWRTLVASKDGTGNAKAPQEYGEVFSVILDATTGQTPSLPGQTYSARQKKGFFKLESLHSRKPHMTVEEMRKAFSAALFNRRFAVTERGYFALVPRGSGVGDRICVFERAHVPFVVRAAQDPDTFALLGESYVHGIMDGEVTTMEDVEMQQLTLV